MLIDMKCSHCGAEDERLIHPSTDVTMIQCKVCGSLMEKIDKLYPVNAQYKGIGVYKTGTY